MGSRKDTPDAPNYAQDYQGGIDVLLKNLPQLLGSEQSYRDLYDPQRIEQQQQLQATYGPEQYRQQLEALKQLDPQGTGIRDALGASISGRLANPENQDLYKTLGTRISGDLASGYELPADYRREVEQGIRGAQAARGNVLGAGAITAEAAIKGKTAFDMYQSRLNNAASYLNQTSPEQKSFANAGSFLSGSTPEQQLLAVQGVSPDRSSAYVNPGAGAAGAQYGLANYGNMLAQYQASGGNQNPWASALGGAASGASVGSVAGPWGAVIGGVAGGAAGYFSDSRLKYDVKEIVTTKAGMPIVRFSYLGSTRKFIGTVAQAVKKLIPEAVGERDGFLTVNYELAGIPFFELQEANQWRG